MRMPVGERAEALDADDSTGGGVRLAEGGTQVSEQRAVGDAAQQSQPAPVVEEARPQSLREREHELAMRHAVEPVLEQATVEEAADCPARCRAQRTTPPVRRNISGIKPMPAGVRRTSNTGLFTR